ncbi:MAG: hypothetical protein NZ823_17150 [Blastocatellia bacterium]|nr:hypothetical protein [Blastocatellia bacterium]
MNVRELIKRHQGIEIRVSAGSGSRDDPYVLEKCDVQEAALTQMNLLRAIGRGLGELWRIVEWAPCSIGSANELIRIDTVRFTQMEIETMTRAVFFDTRAVAGAPHRLHPLICWRGPAGTPVLPYELGWLHFDKVLDNARSGESFDQTIQYSGAGAKAAVYVYKRSGARVAELERAATIILNLNPGIVDPWPVVEVGPFAVKSFLLGKDLTMLGVAVCDSYFVKVRLTFEDDLKMRELMTFTLNVLVACVQQASATKQ